MSSVRPRSARAREIWLVFRFAAVGGFNSAVHALIVLLLSIVVPTALGFVIILLAWIGSIPIGYLSQALLVWRARLSWAGLMKLALSQIPSIVVSTTLSALAGALGVSLLWQEVVALISGALVSYVLQRYWVFADREGNHVVNEKQI